MSTICLGVCRRSGRAAGCLARLVGAQTHALLTRWPAAAPRVPRVTCHVPQVSAIDTCLREEPGRFKCSNVQGGFDE